MIGHIIRCTGYHVATGVPVAVHAIVRGETESHVTIEFIDGADDGSFREIAKSLVTPMPEPALPEHEEPDPGEHWKSDDAQPS